MTHEVAIKWLKMQSSKPVKWDDYSEESREIRETAEQHMKEAFNMAIDALKAQEPVGPVFERQFMTSIEIYDCGKCGTSLGAKGIAKYCMKCGQAVKWE